MVAGAGLADAWAQPGVAAQLPWAGEAGDVAQLRGDGVPQDPGDAGAVMSRGT